MLYICNGVQSQTVWVSLLTKIRNQDIFNSGSLGHRLRISHVDEKTGLTWTTGLGMGQSPAYDNVTRLLHWFVAIVSFSHWRGDLAHISPRGIRKSWVVTPQSFIRELRLLKVAVVATYLSGNEHAQVLIIMNQLHANRLGELHLLIWRYLLNSHSLGHSMVPAVHCKSKNYIKYIKNCFGCVKCPPCFPSFPKDT